MICKLTRITSNHERLRTDDMLGEAEHEPTVGSRFRIIGPPLDKTKDLRAITTTEVLTVQQLGEGIVEFKTRNSHYRFENLEFYRNQAEPTK